MKSIHLTVLYDNYKNVPDLTTDWGFSCLIELKNKTILFDTGADGDILLNNFNKTDKSVSNLDAVFLSHEHWDHTGGLQSILNDNNDLTVIIPETFSVGLKDAVRRSGAELTEVGSLTEVQAEVFSLGVMGRTIVEQSMALITGSGIVVITGCAHPGIVKILRTAKDNFTENIHLAMGGFHMKGMSRGRARKIVSEIAGMGVENVAPSHCTGEVAREEFKAEFEKSYFSSGVGFELEFQ